MTEASGLGESARLCAEQLASDGFEVETTNLKSWRDLLRSRARRSKIKLFHINPPQMLRAVVSIGQANFLSSYNIGFWAWELQDVPDEWIRVAGYMNAIFTPSEFTSQAFRNIPLPRCVVPHPEKKLTIAQDFRRQLGVSHQTFVVSCILNLTSSVERKNPRAALVAFSEFSSDIQDTCLVMKLGPEALPSELEGLVKTLKEQGKRILVVQESWPPEKVLGLLSGSDAYLSLHRSEGFGLTIAEAIQCGTPVVTTGWSGNLDFCKPAVSWLVPYTLVPVSSIHPELARMDTSCWAEPDAHAAAASLRLIFSDPVEARRRAEAAKTQLSAYRAACRYKTALRHLRAVSGSSSTGSKP